MTPLITAALQQLNDTYAETGRQYHIVEDCTYSLSMPLGGYYPPCSEHDMVLRLLRLKLAAEGRDSRPDVPANIFRKGK